MRIAAVAALAVLVSCAPAAVADGPRALRSSNVSWVGTIAEDDGVSVAFSGNHMYLSTFHGLGVYDISDPAAPVEVGRLDLPLFQNEDVSTNGEILLISRDASLGLSRLYVIDVRDPAHPSILSELDTSDFMAPGGAIGHTASCIDDCRYAWLAGWSNGVDVVDLRDPEHPRFASPRKAKMPQPSCSWAGRRKTCFGTHDVQVDSSGLAWVAGFGGTFAYDVSDPVRPVRRFRTNARGQSRNVPGRDPDGSGYNDFIHHNSLRRGNTVFITEEDFRPGCKHPGSLQAWRIGRDRRLRPLDKWEVERDPARSSYCSAHYFDLRDGLIVQGWYEAGARFVDASRPRDLRQSGYWIPRGGNVASAYWAPTDPAGEIVYVLDEQRGVDILRIDRSAPPARRRPPRQARGSGVAAKPDLEVKIRHVSDRIRGGRTVSYSVSVSSKFQRGRRTPAARALVELGAGLTFAEGGGKTRTLAVPRLRSGSGRSYDLAVEVARRPPPWVEASVALLADDGDPANNYSVARDPTRRTRRRTTASAALFCMVRR